MLCLIVCITAVMTSEYSEAHFYSEKYCIHMNYLGYIIHHKLTICQLAKSPRNGAIFALEPSTLS